MQWNSRHLVAREFKKLGRRIFKHCFVCDARFKLFQERQQCQHCHYVVCVRCLPDLRRCGPCLRSREVDQMIHRDEREKAAADCTLKTLLFEANSRTAETILEPFLTKDLYGNLTAFIPKIHRSLVQAAQRLVAATGTGARHEYILGMHSGDPITLENVDHFKALWADMKIQESPSETKNSSLLTLGDKSAEFVEFFFSRLDEIANPDYEPSARDVVTWRAQATGLIQLEFTPPEYGEYGNCLMLDVSRMLATERRKWLPCFDRVSSVTIVVALSDYDMIEETTKTNKLVEALDFFQEIYTLRWVRDVILCLSGRNLFEEKLKRVPLHVCPAFCAYNGPQTCEAALAAIEDAFIMRASDEKMLYIRWPEPGWLFLALQAAAIRFQLEDAGCYPENPYWISRLSPL